MDTLLKRLHIPCVFEGNYHNVREIEDNADLEGVVLKWHSIKKLRFQFSYIIADIFVE
jgi:hypothetical protein